MREKDRIQAKSRWSALAFVFVFLCLGSMVWGQEPVRPIISGISYVNGDHGKPDITYTVSSTGADHIYYTIDGDTPTTSDYDGCITGASGSIGPFLHGDNNYGSIHVKAIATIGGLMSEVADLTPQPVANQAFQLRFANPSHSGNSNMIYYFCPGEVSITPTVKPDYAFIGSPAAHVGEEEKFFWYLEPVTSTYNDTAYIYQIDGDGNRQYLKQVYDGGNVYGLVSWSNANGQNASKYHVECIGGLYRLVCLNWDNCITIWNTAPAQGTGINNIAPSNAQRALFLFEPATPPAPKVKFTPNYGDLYSNNTLEMSYQGESDGIYYTIGSAPNVTPPDPTSSSTPYEGPINVNAYIPANNPGRTIKAIHIDSDGSSEVTSFTLQRARKPWKVSYDEATQQFRINTDSYSTVYYSTTSNVASLSWDHVTIGTAGGYITMPPSTNFWVFATNPNMFTSDVVQLSTPLGVLINPAYGGLPAYASNPSGNTITMTSAEGASIYYTVGATPGATPSDPTTSSTLYQGALNADDYADGTIIKAKAFKNSESSSVVSFTVNHADDPDIDDTDYDGAHLKLTGTAGSRIYYSTSTDTPPFADYVEPDSYIDIESNTTFYAYATHTGKFTSELVTLQSPAISALVITPNYASRTITIATGTQDATIRYALDDPNPSAWETYSAPLEVNPIDFPDGCVLYVVEDVDGSLSDPVSFTVNYFETLPTITAASYSWSGCLATATYTLNPITNAIVRYTTDGSNPNSSSAQTSAQGKTTALSGDIHLKAIAYSATEFATEVVDFMPDVVCPTATNVPLYRIRWMCNTQGNDGYNLRSYLGPADYSNGLSSQYMGKDYVDIATNLVGHEEEFYWSFEDAGVVSDVQYYRIVHRSTGKYLSVYNYPSAGWVTRLTDQPLTIASDSTKFAIEFVSGLTATTGLCHLKSKVVGQFACAWNTTNQNPTMFNSSCDRAENLWVITDMKEDALPDVVFTPSYANGECLYNQNSMTLSTEVEGADIYYTTDGSDPAVDPDLLYSTPFSVNGISVIKAIVVKGDSKSQIGAFHVSHARVPSVGSYSTLTNQLTLFSTSDATIYYSFTSSTASLEWEHVQSGQSITIESGTTFYAFATHPNLFTTDVVTSASPTIVGITSLSQITDPNGFYQLTADIDDASEHTTIASFSGQFDGNHHTITGLTQPIFGTLSNATVKNLYLDNINVSASVDTVGAFANIATGTSRIYNCGILSTDGLVDHTANSSYSIISGPHVVGGLVGSLRGSSRVINCYNYANVETTGTSDGDLAAGIVGYNQFASTVNDLRTLVMNTMMYGYVLVSGSAKGYYTFGGATISNQALPAKQSHPTVSGINLYNYYKYSKGENLEGRIANGTQACYEPYVSRFQLFMGVLNSNRRLCAYYLTDDPENTYEIDKWHHNDTTMISSLANTPYPVLGEWGYYPSAINQECKGSSSLPFQGKQLGTLTVNVVRGAYGTGDTQKTLSLPITDMDTLRNDYNYYKVQLPYYNQLFGGNYEQYGGENRVVTGWKITSVIGGTQGTLVTAIADTNAYNFADRNCTAKDIYSVSGRAFAQGGYYHVPEGVTSITIEAYWGKAIFVSDPYMDLTYSKMDINQTDQGSNYSMDFTLTDPNPETYKGGAVYGLSDALDHLSNVSSVYDQALVLVGNIHHFNDFEVVSGSYHWVKNTNNSYPFSFMSVDADNDCEPDYCYYYAAADRQIINPVRFDFVWMVPLGMGAKTLGEKNTPCNSIFRPKGWFEITETCPTHFSEFEYDSNLGSENSYPIILNNGVIDQMISLYLWNSGATNANHTKYMQIGGHAYVKGFYPGSHISGNHRTKRIPISVTGAQFDRLFLTGMHPTVSALDASPARVYANGGRIDEFCASYMEGLGGDVYGKWCHSLIGDFSGGSYNAASPVTGNVHHSLDYCLVKGIFTGGPKFGDMATGKSINIIANHTVFCKDVFGAGYGGYSTEEVAIMDQSNEIYGNNAQYPLSNLNYYSTNPSNDNGYIPGHYYTTVSAVTPNKTYTVNAILTGYKWEYWPWPSGLKFVQRWYNQYSKLSFTTTHDVNVVLNDCDLRANYYGGGKLGKVQGNITSALHDCKVAESVFGAGFSSEVPSVDILPATNTTAPIIPLYLPELGLFSLSSIPESSTLWAKHVDATLENKQLAIETDSIFTNLSLENLGQVTGDVSLTLDGETTVGGSVYGGGAQSAIAGNIDVSIGGKTHVAEAVYGGGNAGKVGDETHTECDIQVTMKDKAKAGTHLHGGGKSGDVLGSATANLQGNAECYGAYGGGFEGEVSGSTAVVMSGGVVHGNLVGGGENGWVNEAREAHDAVSHPHTTTASISAGLVEGNIYGAGENGATYGHSIATVSGGSVMGDVYGGAMGTHDSVYIAGLKTVNVTGGTIYGNVYGGSQNADDGQYFYDGHDPESNTIQHKPTTSDEIVDLTSFVNISGGKMKKNIYGGGYYGKTYGSIAILCGANAINSIPQGVYNAHAVTPSSASYLDIAESIFAGSNWGVIAPGQDFGEHDVWGFSHMIIDGQGYSTGNPAHASLPYMNIGNSLYGCGTSTDAGMAGRNIMLFNYGYSTVEGEGDARTISMPTRDFYTIQRCDSLVINNSHVNLIGKGNQTSAVTTEKYAVLDVDTDMRLINGSTLAINAPIQSVAMLESMKKTNDAYAPNHYEIVGFPGQAGFDYTLNNCDNKFMFDKGYYLNVNYQNGSDVDIYGTLNGFFHVYGVSSTVSFAFARPKVTGHENAATINPAWGWESMNVDDGGFVSYDSEQNTFDAEGSSVTGGGVQIPYTNQLPKSSKDDSPYLRYWMFKSSEIGVNDRDGVLIARTIGNDVTKIYSATCTIDMPPAISGAGSYYVIEENQFSAGNDIRLINGGIYDYDGDDPLWKEYSFESGDWYYQEGLHDAQAEEYITALKKSPNNTFALTMRPTAGTLGFGDEPQSSAILFARNANDWDEQPILLPADPQSKPELTFMLTYSNAISMNATLDPFVITVKEYKPADNPGDPDVLVNTTRITLVVTTVTNIEQNVSINEFAQMMNIGTTHDTFTGKVTLPAFTIADPNNFATFRLVDVQVIKGAVGEGLKDLKSASFFDGNTNGGATQFGLVFGPALTYANMNGWEEQYGSYDVKDLDLEEPIVLGLTDGRKEFSIDFTLHYNGAQLASNAMIDTVRFTIQFDNYLASGSSKVWNTIIIDVNVHRRGSANGFYLDGVSGSNANSGIFPDDAKRTLKGIFDNYDPEHPSNVYAAGDLIFVVNDANIYDDDHQWNGAPYGEVKLLRYPGGHEQQHETPVVPPNDSTLVTVNAGAKLTAHNITLDGLSLKSGPENTSHEFYSAAGPINLPVTNQEFDIVLESGDEEGVGDLMLLFNSPVDDILVTDPNEICDLDPSWIPVTSGEPPVTTYQYAIAILCNAESIPTQITLNISSGTSDAAITDLRLVENERYNPAQNYIIPYDGLLRVADGGNADFTDCKFINNNNYIVKSSTKADDQGQAAGVIVEEGGVLTLRDSEIRDNHMETESDDLIKGAGLHLDGTVYVTGDVRIEDNSVWYKSSTTDSTFLTRNVYLPEYENKMLIGVSELSDLDATTRIGVTKTDFQPFGSSTEKAYTPVASSCDESLYQYAVRAFGNVNFFDDLDRYPLFYSDMPRYDKATDYFHKTWVTQVTSQPSQFSVSNIDSKEDLAWFISYVNGFNGSEAHPDADACLTADVDMTEYVFIPIGNAEHPYTGTFDGGYRTIDGINAYYPNLDAIGVFGHVQGTVKNTFVRSGTLYSSEKDGALGGIVGILEGDGLIRDCQSADSLRAYPESCVIGGLVGRTDAGSGTPRIHSSYSVAKMYGFNMGGLVGELGEGSFLENSFAAAGFNVMNEDSTKYKIGGLVGINNGKTANCYVRLRNDNEVYGNTYGLFAGSNSDTISYCYAPQGIADPVYVATGNAPLSYAHYTPTVTPYYYKHADNDLVNLSGFKLPNKKWPAMLNQLNAWIDSTSTEGVTYSRWMRTTSPLINNDYPVHKAQDFNTLFVTNDNETLMDSVLLRYSADFNQVVTDYTNANTAIDIYDTISNVSVYNNTSSAKLYINEGVSMLTDYSSSGKTGEALRGYAGVTFDNSSRSAHASNGTLLGRDWHLFSSPFADAPLGINYNGDIAQHDFWESGDTPQYDFYSEDEYDGFFPSCTYETKEDYYADWDFYCFYENQYHWINFKRNSASHYHEDGEHLSIAYTNETEMQIGKGYMMAIQEDTYMQAYGSLNDGTFTAPVSVGGDYLTGYNLLGNPYLSYLDFDAFATVNSALWNSSKGKNPFKQAYLVYDADVDGFIGYAKGASSGNGWTASRYINPMQGFFVYADNAGNATFTNDMRTLSKDESTQYRGEVKYPLINLWVNNGVSGNDILVVELGHSEVGGSTKMKSLKTGDAILYAHQDNNDFNIFFAAPDATHVPVWFETAKEDTYTLYWETQNADFSALYLVDNLTGMRVNCLETDHYTFSASKQDYKSRFKLIFKFTDVEEHSDEDESSDAPFAFMYQGNLMVNGTGHFQFVDLNGRVLVDADLHDVQNTVMLPNVSSGVYLVRMTDSRSSKVQKIIIHQ